jgi:hypothetical protein
LGAAGRDTVTIVVNRDFVATDTTILSKQYLDCGWYCSTAIVDFKKLAPPGKTLGGVAIRRSNSGAAFTRIFNDLTTDPSFEIFERNQLVIYAESYYPSNSIDVALLWK